MMYRNPNFAFNINLRRCDEDDRSAALAGLVAASAGSDLEAAEKHALELEKMLIAASGGAAPDAAGG